MSDSNSRIKELARNVRKDPADSFSRFALALELLKRNQLEKSRILFESVLQQDPEYVGVYYHVGKLYERMNMSQQALESYRNGIEIARKQEKQRTLAELEEALAELEEELSEEKS